MEERLMVSNIVFCGDEKIKFFNDTYADDKYNAERDIMPVFTWLMNKCRTKINIDPYFADTISFAVSDKVIEELNNLLLTNSPFIDVITERLNSIMSLLNRAKKITVIGYLA